MTMKKKTSTVAFMCAAFYFCRSSYLKCEFSLCFVTDFTIDGRNRKVISLTLVCRSEDLNGRGGHLWHRTISGLLGTVLGKSVESCHIWFI